MKDKEIIAWQNLQISALNKVAEDYSKYIRKLDKENAELKEKLAGAERTRGNLKQIGFPTFQSCKEYADKMNYAKAIIKDLLDNSDEYARQRASDFFEGGIEYDWLQSYRHERMLQGFQI